MLRSGHRHYVRVDLPEGDEAVLGARVTVRGGDGTVFLEDHATAAYRREPDGSHVLVTPAEKLAIAVEDTPFRAVEMKSEGEGEARKLVFRLDTDDLVIAGADHPLDFGGDPDNPDPRLHVRGAIGNGLEARIDRALYYEIVDMALAEGGEPPAIWSDGARFPLVDA